MRTVEVVEGTRLGEQAFRLFQENLVLSESNITNLQARLNREARDRGYFYENPRGVARPPREIYEQTLRLSVGMVGDKIQIYAPTLQLRDKNHKDELFIVQSQARTFAKKTVGILTVQKLRDAGLITDMQSITMLQGKMPEDALEDHENRFRTWVSEARRFQAQLSAGVRRPIATDTVETINKELNKKTIASLSRPGRHYTYQAPAATQRVILYTTLGLATLAVAACSTGAGSQESSAFISSGSGITTPDARPAKEPQNQQPSANEGSLAPRDPNTSQGDSVAQMELIPLNETSEQAFLNGEDLSVPWDSSSYGDNPDGTTRVGFGNLIPGDLTLDKNGNIIISIHNPTRESFTLTQKRLGPHQFVCQNSEGNDVQCMINPHILLFAINSLRGAEHIQVMFFAQGFKDYRDRNSIPPSMTRDEVASLGITYLEPGVRGTHTPPINGSKVKNAAMGYWRDEYLFEATFDRGIEFFLFKTFPYQLQAPTNS